MIAGLDGRTLDDLWKRMLLLLWERRAGLCMSLEIRNGSACDAEMSRAETDLCPLDL